MEDGRGGTKTIWIVVGVVAVVFGLCCIGLLTFGFLSFQEAVEERGGFVEGLRGVAEDMAGESHDEAQAFCALFLTDHDVDAAWEQTSPGFRQVTDRKGFDDIGDSVLSVLGDLQEMRLQNYNVNHKMGMAGNSTTHVLFYDADFTKGAGTIQVTLLETGGKFLLHGIHVNSPLFLDPMKAPLLIKRTKGADGQPAEAPGETPSEDDR